MKPFELPEDYKNHNKYERMDWLDAALKILQKEWRGLYNEL
jgi:hypothetical protein